MKQIFFRKMHSNQEMLDDRNECSQKTLFGVETVRYMVTELPMR